MKMKRKKKKNTEDSFAKKMIMKIVNNIQVYIDKVHIRYEDDLSTDHPFTFGITLESLYAQSTNDKWEPTFISTPEKLVHKLVSLKNLSVYWNSGDKFISQSSNMLGELEMMIYQDIQKIKPKHHYLIQPICGDLKAYLYMSDDINLSIPKITLDFVFKEIGLSLEESQFKEVLNLADYIGNYIKGKNVRKYRPKERPNKNPKAWWKFISQVILGEVRERRKTWTFEYMKKKME